MWGSNELKGRKASSLVLSHSSFTPEIVRSHKVLHIIHVCVCVCVCVHTHTYMYMWKWKSVSHVQLFVTPWATQSMDSPGQNTGVGSHSLLQRIFPTQGSNPGLPQCRRILYQLSHKGSPKCICMCVYLALLYQSGFLEKMAII